MIQPQAWLESGEIGFWAALWVVLLQGFLGSMHCVGMCGPFVHLFNARADNATQPGSRRSQMLRNVVYNLMRSLSYMSVGFFLGLIGKTANVFFMSSTAAIIAALLMLFFGFQYIWMGSTSGMHAIRLPSWFSHAIGPLLRGRNGLEGPALMGMITGLLPCGLLYPAYGVALGTGEPLAGAFLMFAFSLGTYPAMLLVGLASDWMWKKLRGRWPAMILGLSMILYAFWIIYIRWTHAATG